MSKPFTGGCLCGAIRYECGAEPMFPGHCHCRDCQKASGTGHMSAFAVPEDSLTLTGELTFFDVTTDAGNISSRGFCPTCGGRVISKGTGFPGLLIIQAGSMDDPSLFKPGMEIYTSSAQPWDAMDPDLPKFEKMPSLPSPE